MNINLLAPINGLGYGVASLNTLAGLVSEGHDVALFPIGGQGAIRDVPTDKHGLIRASLARRDSYDAEAPSLRIFHQFDLAEHVGRGPRIGFPFFELDRFKPGEAHHMKQMDRLIVASQWARAIVNERLPAIPTFVANLGVDTGIFHPGLAPESKARSINTVFATVGKWEYRKGHDFLIAAFNAAFKPSDRVILRLACHNPFLSQQQLSYWTEKCTSSPMARRIEHAPRFKDQAGVASFLANAHCGVWLSRAEAWNLEPLEAMACGTHVILTDASAHSEYGTNENSRLVSVSEQEDAHDGIWFHGEGRWAALGADQLDQTVTHMRHIHELHQTGRLGINEFGIATARRFGWDNTARAVVRACQ